MKPLTDFGEILPFLRPGSTVVLHSACAEPRYLARQLAVHAKQLQGVRLITLMPMGEVPYAAPELSPYLSLTTFYPGKGLRRAANAGRVEVLRTSLGNLPKLFLDRALRVDAVMLQLAPPGADGQLSLGIAVDYMRAVLAQNPLVVAEINPQMPRTCGDTRIRQEDIDFVTLSREPPQPAPAAAPSPVDERIADNVAGLLFHGAVVQAGIGSLPDLVLARLGALRGLGIHSGIISDSLLALIERGAVTNAGKSHFPGVCVTTMAAGTQSLYDALHENPAVEFHPCSVTHNVEIIAGLEGFCAINSVLQIDLAGRANAERVEGKLISTPGGLPDFARGARLAKGGRSIVALRATSAGGRSNIIAALAADVPVAVTADDIDYVVTEHGVARLTGLDPARRAEALIAVAEPDCRAGLRARTVR